MKAGTIVKLPDGSIGTVVYNGLDGVGIKWGEITVNEALLRISGMSQGEDAAPKDFPYFPDAMLRDPYASAELPCVGEEFEIVRRPRNSFRGGAKYDS